MVPAFYLYVPAFWDGPSSEQHAGSVRVGHEAGTGSWTGSDAGDLSGRRTGGESCLSRAGGTKRGLPCECRCIRSCVCADGFDPVCPYSKPWTGTGS